MYQIETIGAASSTPLAALSRKRNSRTRRTEAHGEGDTTAAVSLIDLSAVYPQAVLASSKDLGWQHISVLHVLNEYDAMDIPPLENHCVIVQLESPVCVSGSIDGQSFDDFLSPGDIAIIPAGLPSQWRWPDGKPHETVHIYLEPGFVEKIADTCNLDHGHMAFEPRIAVRDEQLSHLAMSLLYELKDENVVGRFYADSVASAVAIQLVRRYGCLKDVAIRKGGMAPHKLRRALEFITDNLEQPNGIALNVIASEVGMSRYHFSRVFKESMGVSPFNYILRQRIERAKKLLTETDLPIADVALQSGFSGQSHFATFFRKLVGLTPRSFRRTI